MLAVAQRGHRPFPAHDPLQTRFDLARQDSLDVYGHHGYTVAVHAPEAGIDQTVRARSGLLLRNAQLAEHIQTETRPLVCLQRDLVYPIRLQVSASPFWPCA